MGVHREPHRARRPRVLGTGHALLISVLVAVQYLAIEPYFRRLWPKLLGSWVRILDGRFRDPLVGRDVLLGALVASAVATMAARVRLAMIVAIE